MKITKIYKPYMKRPIVYKTYSRFFIGLLLALLWDRFINTNQLLSVVEHAFFAVGVFLAAMAWFDYLNLDGVRIHHLYESKDRSKKRKHQHRDIVDFVNQKIVSFDDLDYDEQVFCKLLSNLLAGGIFIVISLISSLL